MFDCTSPSLAMMGTFEWVIVGAAILLLFGARKLPELAHSMGASISSFKKGMKEAADGEKLSDGQGSSGAKRTIDHDSH